MLDDPVDVFAASLKKLGYSINTRNPDELRKAQYEAIEQKEFLRAYINGEVQDQLVAGDVLAAAGYTVYRRVCQQLGKRLRTCLGCQPLTQQGRGVDPRAHDKRCEMVRDRLNFWQLRHC
jgi:spermidine/putrescine transport system substrate-binding protein